jgi:hypothetical protein
MQKALFEMNVQLAMSSAILGFITPGLFKTPVIMLAEAFHLSAAG